MVDDNPPKRPATHYDRPCDQCGFRMIGIMLETTHTAPRTICRECVEENAKKNG